MIRQLLAVVLPLAAAGCAGADGAYPSLAPRAVEKQGFDEPAARTADAAVPDPALDAQVAKIDAQLRAIVAGFDTAAREAGRRAGVARGRAAGSEAWLEAQTALAALDDWRAQTSALTTDVEQLAIARAAALAPPYPALVAIDARTDAEAQRQGETIARLQAMLAPA